MSVEVMRVAEGKSVVEVHDYVDVGTAVLQRMHAKRLPVLRDLGFEADASGRSKAMPLALRLAYFEKPVPSDQFLVERLPTLWRFVSTRLLPIEPVPQSLLPEHQEA